MEGVPGYRKSNEADNMRFFHGREIRRVPTAAGGMGFVLELSLAGEDVQGWTAQEKDEYDGWGHDSKRKWRRGEQLLVEGVLDFQKMFGVEAYGLHHRFYWHVDKHNRLWLSAEDGCEGFLSFLP